MAEAPGKARGSLIVSVLAGAWRHSPPWLALSTPQLDHVADLLLGSLAGALAWWKVRHSDLKNSAVALELQEAYHFHTIRSALREHTIKQAINLLAAAGVEPILVKGWAVARLYPEPGLRPYGDFDLVVRPKGFGAASAVAKEIRGEYGVDLHSGFSELDYHSFDELYARSVMVKLDDVNVRLLSPEDHLRVLCFHMLHHSAFRPLWLCDIAVAVETRAADFNWGICLGNDRRRADWIACAIGLAHRLLGAEIDDTPLPIERRPCPHG